MYTLLIKNRQLVINLFKIVYVVVSIFAGFAFVTVTAQTSSMTFYYGVGKNFGQAALLIYISTLIPGILKRFSVQHPVRTVLMMYRRYLGLLMYTCAIAHASIVKLSFWISSGYANPLLFEVMGATVFAFLLPLFLTSNDFSVQKMGPWWGKIHKLTYVAMFFLLLHVGMQKIGIWTLIMSLVILAEIASFIFSRFFKKNPV